MTPVYVYLDQNQWIYLARDYLGKPHKPTHRGVATKVLAAVASDRVRLPLSWLHFIEHLRAEDPARRQRLAAVFQIFSGGWYMASWARVLPVEIRQAVFRVFGQRLSVPAPEVFGRGFLFGLGPKETELLRQGRTDEQLQYLEAIAAMPGAVLHLLTSQNEAGRKRQNERVTQSGRAYSAAAERIRKVRQPEAVAVHRRAQYAGYTFQHQRWILEALACIGRTGEDFLGLGLEQLTQFWASVPSLDVDCELTVYRDRQWSRHVHQNDVRDIGHLALAVPYCDMVITERFWTRASEQIGLSRKYGTRICSNLGELLEVVS